MLNNEIPAVWEKRWLENNFTEPTAIQQAVFEPLRKQQSIMGISPTGSGKTLAYLLPTLLGIKKGEGNQVLIVTSSQELAMQVLEVSKTWAEDLGIAVQSAIGGANIQRQIEKLKHHPELIVGTPGRIVELIRARKMNPFLIQTVIFDEADQLINNDQQGLVKEIIQAVGKKSTFGFFSATADAALSPIKKIVPDLLVIDVTQVDTSQGAVAHQYIMIPARKKVESLRRLAHTPDFQSLVFFNQLSELGMAEEKLQFHHIQAASLASDQNKQLRKLALTAFRERKIQLLLATDIAARGLDIDRLPFIVNAEVPLTKESYVHRAGRVGRMGADGRVLTLVTEQSVKDLKKLANQLNLILEEVYLVGGAIQTEKPEKKEPTTRVLGKVKETKKKIVNKEAVHPKMTDDIKESIRKKRTKVKTKNKKNKGKRKEK